MTSFELSWLKNATAATSCRMFPTHKGISNHQPLDQKQCIRPTFTGFSNDCHVGNTEISMLFTYILQKQLLPKI